MGYVVRKNNGLNIGPGIGVVGGGATAKVYVGRTDAEATAEKTTAGTGDHVGVIATAGTKPPTTKSNGAAPQGIVIEGSGTNVAKDCTTTPPTAAKHYSKNQAKFFWL